MTEPHGNVIRIPDVGRNKDIFFVFLIHEPETYNFVY